MKRESLNYILLFFVIIVWVSISSLLFWNLPIEIPLKLKLLILFVSFLAVFAFTIFFLNNHYIKRKMTESAFIHRELIYLLAHSLLIFFIVFSVFYAVPIVALVAFIFYGLFRVVFVFYEKRKG